MDDVTIVWKMLFDNPTTEDEGNCEIELKHKNKIINVLVEKKYGIFSNKVPHILGVCCNSSILSKVQISISKFWI